MKHTRRLPDFLVVITEYEAAKLLSYIDHTLIFRREDNRKQFRSIEREAIKVVNGDKRSALVNKWIVRDLVKLYRKHYEKNS